MPPTKIDLNPIIGVLGMLASMGLAQWQAVAGMSAAFATAVYMLLKSWVLIRTQKADQKPEIVMKDTPSDDSS